MKKIQKIIFIILIILVAWAFLRFVVGGPEDDWICVDNQWVKHGVPSAPMPTEPCGESQIVTDIDDRTCEVDSDCAVFGEDGDCNCGCFNKNHNWKKEGDCFCAAPKTCKCVIGKCEPVF